MTEKEYEYFNFHELIDPHVNAFKSIVAGAIGWRLVKSGLLQQIISKGPNDRFAMASEALKKQKKRISFSFEKAMIPLIESSVDHNKVISAQTQQLIGHTFEILREHGKIPKASSASPEFEFYRHVRNGCFHGNKFNFLGNEPRFPAEWRDLIIDNNLQGKRVFRESHIEPEFFINWGDAILLLADISKQL